jgi:hypothetical protein
MKESLLKKLNKHTIRTIRHLEIFKKTPTMDATPGMNLLMPLKN